MKFEFDGHVMAFRGTLTTVSADNLAAWNIGGFKALASAFRKCQYCMAVDDDMQTKVRMIVECKYKINYACYFSFLNTHFSCVL